MNNNNPSQFLQQGFRIAIGAISSLIETAQNPEKRTEAISDFQMELTQKTREWAAKGEITEQEARKVIDDFLRQRAGSNYSDSYSTTSSPQENGDRSGAYVEVNSGLQELRNDIVALRSELAKMRETKD